MWDKLAAAANREVRSSSVVVGAVISMPTPAAAAAAAAEADAVVVVVTFPT